MAGRPWTSKEDAIIRRHYKKKSVAWIAQRVDRTDRSVYQRAKTLGLCEERNQSEIDDRKSQIVLLLSQGLSDSEVANQVGMDRRALTEMRNRMGIEANGRNDRYRQRVSQKTREQCRRAGVANLAAIRAKQFRQFVDDLGWPNLSVRAAQIAETLHRNGPMTRRQICQAVGLRWKGSRHSLSNSRVPGGSYMAELQRAGIVVRLESAISLRGSGNQHDLYMIALGKEPCRTKE